MNVHDLHIWGLSSDRVALTCHILSKTPMASLKKAKRMLEQKYNISHATISMENPEDKDYEDDCGTNIHAKEKKVMLKKD